MGVDRQHDFEGEIGNERHITRRVYGTVPLSKVTNMPGARGEIPGVHRNKLGPQWDKFKSDIQEHGIREPIFITHDYGKQPVISEGNHRRDAAAELGMEEVPVEVAYFGHAEHDDSLFNDRRQSE